MVPDEVWNPIPGPAQMLPDGYTLPFSVVEQPNGAVLLSDRAHGELWRVEFTTGIRAPVGSRGNGPGEYQRINEVFAWAGDSVAIVAYGAPYRIAILTPSGAPARTIELMSREQAMATGMASMNELPPFTRSDASGTLYGQRIAFRRVPGQGSLPLDSVPIMRMGTSTLSFDTITYLPIGQRTGWHRDPRGSASYVVGLGTLAAVNDWTVLANGTVVLVNASTYELTFVSPDGRRRRVAVSSSAREPVSDKDWKRLIDSSRAEAALAARAMPIRTAMSVGVSTAPALITPEKPTSYPLVLAAFNRVTTSGHHLWIPVPGPDSPNRDYWDVVDTTGVVHATFALEPNTKLIAVTANYVYTSQRDDDDLMWVSRRPNPVR